MKSLLTREIAYAAGWDVSNRSMHKARRGKWNMDDWNEAAKIINKLLDLIEQKKLAPTCTGARKRRSKKR